MDLHPHMMTHLLRTSSASLSFGCMDVWSEEELWGLLDLDEMDDDMKFVIESCESGCVSCRTVIASPNISLTRAGSERMRCRNMK